MVPLDPLSVMQSLARRRFLFHSEADLQQAFASELHRFAPECNIRLEVPVRTASGSIHLDLLASSQSGQVAIELKYKTRSIATTLDGEDFNLMSHAAQDLGRYDFFKDLKRVEGFAASGPGRAGCAIFLTNDSAYWKAPSTRDHGYADFAMNDGRDISGSLGWGERASDGTRRGRQEAIELAGSYRLNWLPYSSVDVKSYGEFRYLCVQALPR